MFFLLNFKYDKAMQFLWKNYIIEVFLLKNNHFFVKKIKGSQSIYSFNPFYNFILSKEKYLCF